MVRLPRYLETVEILYPGVNYLFTIPGFPIRVHIT